ncbi:MAG: hypothetical protein A3D13_08740 [Planctomycetes bacterium RIFCSPHIGHO2_02_FULL_40_12]|nr:MAG: hypothetical protein A3D13_08740 [Planctomycetes bacterium RIFCSPHIGHO2_02_FULL_40_12]
MVYKKFIKTVAPVIMYILMWGGNLMYAAGAEHKHGENDLSTEHQIAELPMCPFCKEVRASSEKERVLAAKSMVCPDCKSEVSALEIHHCDKCGKDVLICTMCQKASASLKAETMIGKCPKCKKVLSRYVKGKVLATWKMKCRDCRMKSHEWLIQHCKTCNIDFLACPICEKEQERFQK